MDAHALLTSQGWRGSGHSLHPTTDKNMLSRPLLVSRKQNNLGVGKKQHKTSDMWWLNAFDKSLKGLDTAQEGKVVQTVTNGGLDMLVRGGSKFVRDGGLYASFVRGESLSGTISPEELEGPQAVKRQKWVEGGIKSRDELRTRKAAKRAARAHSLPATQLVVPELVDGSGDIVNEKEEVDLGAVETKEHRQERRRQRKLMRHARGRCHERCHTSNKEEEATERLYMTGMG